MDWITYHPLYLTYTYRPYLQAYHPVEYGQKSLNQQHLSKFKTELQKALKMQDEGANGPRDLVEFILLILPAAF